MTRDSDPSGLKKTIIAPVITALIVGLITGAVGFVISFYVSEARLDAQETALAEHRSSTGHPQLQSKVARLEQSVDNLEAAQARESTVLEQRMDRIERTLDAIGRDQSEILRSLPTSWRRERERER